MEAVRVRVITDFCKKKTLFREIGKSFRAF